jgi:hypothetical protein
MLPSGRVRTEDRGVHRLDDIPYETTLYADQRVALDLAHRHGHRVYLYNDRPTTLQIQAHYLRKVRILPDFPGSGPEVLEGLAGLRDALTGYGAAGDSLGAMGWSLLRATVPHPVYTWGGSDPVPLPEVIGGRQLTALPGYHRRFTQLDVSAAYASTLGRLVYSGRWEPWSFLGVPPADWPLPSFHDARVWIPRSSAIGPLPRRRGAPVRGDWLAHQLTQREYPTGSHVTGIYSAPELRVAADAGATVHVRRSWIAIGDTDRRPFSGWWTAISEIRKLPGLAGEYGKLIGNVVIGRMMISDRRLGWVEWNPDNTIAHRKRYPGSSRRIDQAWDLAELVTSTVRAKLYADVLGPYGSIVIGAHTDGVLLTEDVPVPDGWRVKVRGSGMLFLGPQLWAYRDPEGWRYTFSGCPPEQVPRAFGEIAREHYGQGWRRKIRREEEEPWQVPLPV